MNTKINELIEYIKKQFPDVVINESNTTDSIYIKIPGREIRLADHIGILSENREIQVLIPQNSNDYIVVIGLKIYIYKTLHRVGDLITDYMLINNNITAPRREGSHKAYLQLCGKQTELKETLAETLDELKKLKEKHQNLVGTYNALQKNQVLLKAGIKEKDDAIKEAVELIEELSTNKEAREYLYNREKGKMYFLDNFSEDAREMIKELIKEYYSK